MTPAKLAVNTSGIPIRGRIYALHGVTDNAASLSDISQRWSETFEVICVDALGHGCSPRFSDGELLDPFEALVQSTAALIKNPAPFVVLMGHSMGGATAAELVSRGLVHIDALVLEDPALLTTKQREDFRELGASLVARCDEVTQNLGREIALLLKDYPLWSPSEGAGWAQGKVQADREFLKRGIVGHEGRWRCSASRAI